MEFDRFATEVSKIKNLDLPGLRSHHKMAPMARLEALRKLDPASYNPSQAGVMALFYPDSRGATHFLLILRNSYPGVHSNQVGFPGGKAEPEDGSILQTALRETEEEVGVPGPKVEVVRALTELYIPPSNFQVYPFLGFVQETPEFRPDPAEVARVLEIPLEQFMDDRVLTQRRMRTSYAQEIEVPAYLLADYVVWGATAMMLSEIRELFGQIL